MFLRLLRTLRDLVLRLNEPKPGQRVVLVTQLDIFPDGIIHKGATGVVTSRSWSDRLDEPVGEIHFHQPQPALAQWNNRLHVYPKGSTVGSATWADFVLAL